MTKLCSKAGMGLLVVFSFVVFSCKEDKKTDVPAGGGARNAGPLGVEVIVVKPSSLASAIEVPGSLLPFESTDIRSEISGRVVSLNLQEGMNVSKGTLLVKLFDGDLQAQLSKLQVQLQIAEKTVERQKQLLTIGGISQQEYDLSELQINNLKADIELVKVNISKTEIRAPFSGRLGLKNISMGAYISPSTLISSISEVDKLKLQFTVPEKYGSLVQRGQDVKFELDGSDKNYKASVMATETTIEENTRSLAVRAVLGVTDNRLVPGAFAKVQMILGKQNDALLIPTECIIPSGRNKQVVVYKDGQAVFNNVTTGVRDSANIQILSGLNANDTVVTTGLLFVKPGSSLKITKLK